MRLQHLPSGAVTLVGPLGRMLEKSIANRLKKIHYAHLVDPFRFRYEKDGAWRCEFWGKIVRSALLSWRDNPDAELLALLKDTVNDILATQTSDGCISSYPVELQTSRWDIWGRKYVLLALARYYQFVERDQRVSDACIHLLDHLMTQVGPDAKDILATGCHDGLAASSILNAVVEVYRMSGERRHLDYAEWIVRRGCSQKHNIFTAILDGTIPADLGNGKAYEMMSCFQGLAELYMETENSEYLKPVLAFYNAVRDREVIITGVGGSRDLCGEYWNDTALKQLCTDCGSFGETCVTTTWLHYCDCVLRLTADSKIADEMEKSHYNGILGGVSNDGNQWIHMNPTPLAGASCKIPSDDQIGRGFKTPFDGHDCCLAQGPEALAMGPYSAAFCHGQILYLNYYENMSLCVSTPSGQSTRVEITGGYPAFDVVRLQIQVEVPERFGIALRIPEWNGKAAVIHLDGEDIANEAGTYCVIEREWHGGECLVVQFDMCPRIRREADRVAVICGPLVMVQDSRLGAVGVPVSDMEFKKTEASEEFYSVVMNQNGERLCDYASAGKPFEQGNTICVWLKTKTTNKK